MDGDHKADAAQARDLSSHAARPHRWGTVIELGERDEVAYLRPKLEAAESSVVALVVPKEIEAFRDTLPLRLLRRHAESLGKEVVLVTPDWVTREAALREGFRVYLPNEFENSQAPAETTRTVSQETAAPRTGARRRPIMFAGAIVAAAVGLAALAYLLLPSATVIIAPASQIVSDTVEVTAAIGRQDMDLAAGQIPAQRVQFALDVSDWLSTTGKRAVPDQPAVGEVAFINLTSQPVTVPLGSRVGTDGGIWFATDAAVEVPPAGSESQARVDITAIRPGRVGNVPSLAIQRFEDSQLRYSLRLLNESPTHGGSDRDVGYVTEQDKRRLREKLIEGARSADREEFLRQLGPAQTFFPETIEVSLSDERFDSAVGQDAEELKLEAKATLTALAFRQADLDALARASLEGDSQALIMDGSLRTRLLEAVRWDRDSVSFRFFAQGRMSTTIDQEQIKQALVGMSAEQAQDYLRQRLPQAERAQVVVFPDWLDRLPWFAWRITVEVLGGR